MNQCTLKICPTFNVKSEIYDSIENQPTVFKRLRYQHMSRDAYSDLQVLRPSDWPLQFTEFRYSIHSHACNLVFKNIFSDSLIWLCETKIRRETLQASVRSVISHIHFGGCGWLHHGWTWWLESRDWVDSFIQKTNHRDYFWKKLQFEGQKVIL